MAMGELSASSPTAVAQRRDPVRLRGWRPWGWALLVTAALLTVSVEAVGGFLIGLEHLSTCNDAPDPADVHAGQAAVLRLMLGCVIPWAVASALIKPRTRVVVTGLMATAPVIYTWVIGFRTESWVGGFCI